MKTRAVSNSASMSFPMLVVVAGGIVLVTYLVIAFVETAIKSIKDEL